jgi:hypothetical protein
VNGRSVGKAIEALDGEDLGEAKGRSGEEGKDFILHGFLH